MADHPTGRYEGQDVVIDFDKKEVKVRRVTGWLFWKREEWVDAPLERLQPNTWWSRSLGVGLEKFSIRDLPLTIEEISKGLGVTRLDSQCAVRIWESPHSIRRDNVAIDFSSCELVTFYPTSPQSRPTLVIPFSAIAGVVDRDPPRIIKKNVTFGQEEEIRGLPISAATLAEKLGVELIDGVEQRDWM
jgi:hypothetical protein